MTGQEDIAGSPEIDGELINLSRVHELGFCLGTSVARPENAVRQVLGKSIGPDVHQLGRKVGIHGRRAGIEFQRDRPGHLEIFFENWG